MSGDLHVPAHAIPRGTLPAVIATGLVSVCMAHRLGGRKTLTVVWSAGDADVGA